MMDGKPEAVPLPSMFMLCPVAFIQETVALSYRIDPLLMRHKTRRRSATWPRQVAMYLAREITRRPKAEIGRRFNRDHSTVFHAIKAVEKRMAKDEIYRADVEALLDALQLSPENDKTGDNSLRKNQESDRTEAEQTQERIAA